MPSDFGWHRFRFSPCLMRIIVSVIEIARYHTMIDFIPKRLFCRLQPVAKNVETLRRKTGLSYFKSLLVTRL